MATLGRRAVVSSPPSRPTRSLLTQVAWGPRLILAPDAAAQRVVLTTAVKMLAPAATQEGILARAFVQCIPAVAADQPCHRRSIAFLDAWPVPCSTGRLRLVYRYQGRRWIGTVNRYVKQEG